MAPNGHRVRRGVSRLAVLVVSAASCLISRRALAVDPAAAQALFEEGRELVSAGKLDEGCSKFRESEKLDPGIGTLFNLADCEERRGRVATAWATFLEVESRSRAAGQDARVQAAATRAALLERRMPTVSIVVTANLPGLTVQRNGAQVGPGQWGSRLPVDPGPQQIVVAAPGYEPWVAALNVEEGGPTAQVTVPPLRRAATLTEPSTPQMPGRTQRITGLVLAGTGVVALGTSAVFGLMAMSKNDASLDGHCLGNRCDMEGLGLRQDARAAGDVGTVFAVVGGATLLGGAALYFTASKGPSAAAASWTPRLVSVPGGLGAGVGVGGTL